MPECCDCQILVETPEVLINSLVAIFNEPLAEQSTLLEKLVEASERDFLEHILRFSFVAGEFLADFDFTGNYRLINVIFPY